jgi:hypothetical protein
MSKTNVMVDTLRRIAPAIGLVGAAFFLPGCYAGVDEDVAYYPSAGFIATEQPVFYDRDAGGRWGYYRSEPAFLAQRRAGPGPGFARRTYERPAAPRPAPPRR